MKKQAGYLNLGDSLYAFMVVLAIVSAVVGWAIIDFLLWIFSNLSIVWG